MLKRLRARRWRLRSTVHMVGGRPVRLTYQRGELAAVEFWTPSEHASFGFTQYEYTVIKGHINPRGQLGA